MGYMPNFSITAGIANDLMAIEGVKQSIVQLPITARVLVDLRRTARLSATHHSTQIEGNRLTDREVVEVLENAAHFPDRKRDEWEIKGYYAALEYLEERVRRDATATQEIIQTLHGLALFQGRGKPKRTPYRDGQNVIKDSRSGAIVYLPPEAKDVPGLMTELVDWVNDPRDLPIPVVASIAHYQFATIHPYFDGNGRTARLLTMLILHLGGYDLKGLFALEEYYAQDLAAYYEALTIGPSHNYYMGRAEADITGWVQYFIQGMAVSFKNVERQAQEASRAGSPDASAALRTLSANQRKSLELFQRQQSISASDLVQFFGIKPRTASGWCNKWVEEGFLVMTNPSRKARGYALAEIYESLIL